MKLYAVISGHSLHAVISEGCIPSVYPSKFEILPCTQSLADCFANDPKFIGWADNRYKATRMWTRDGEVITLHEDVTRENWEKFEGTWLSYPTDFVIA